jgi:DNA-binding HxlR family transcriptional regulator
LKLKILESEKLIKKLKNGSYSATPRGRGLRMVESAMRRYGEKYL